MTLRTQSIPSLFNGVSQQPPVLRLPSQCESLVNGYPTVADGLTKRPGSQHIAELSGVVSGDAFIHVIDRDADNRYLLLITDENLKVFDLSDGSAESIVYESSEARADSTAYVLGDVVRPSSANKRWFRCTTAGTTGGSEPTWDTDLGASTADGTVVWETIPNYLALPDGATASESYAVVTVANYSFIVNKTVTVQTTDINTGTPTYYSSWYFPDNWTLTDDETRYYEPVQGSTHAYSPVQTLADLPTADDPMNPASEGSYLVVQGDDVSGFSKYYVIYRSGVWVETHEKGGGTRLDEATMPHALVLESDGDFHLRQFGWVPRLVGDDASNPNPSFVGDVITDVAYHKNRLAFASGENIVFSGAGDFGMFYRTTVTQLLDSDRVDLQISTADVNEINWILPAENGLMFFSDNKQFVLNVDEILTPNTASADVATSYAMNPNVKPIDIGQDVYYVTEAGDYSRLREYTLGNNSNLATDATDITAHVPRYVPSDIIRLAGSSNEDLLVGLSKKTGFKNRLYVYKFYWSDERKIQSAWFYWDFASGDVIRDVAVLDDEIYLVVEHATATFLHKINVQSTDLPLALTFDILLDRRYNFESGDKSYDSTDTTFTLPWVLTAAEQDDFRLVLGDGATVGRVLDPESYEWVSAYEVKFAGDWTSTEVFGGLNYEFEFQFSEQFPTDGQGNAITTGRYQLRTFTVYFEDTAFFNTVVAPYGNDALTEDVVTEGLQAFTGKTLGADNLLIGTPVFSSGTYAFQIYGSSKVATVKLTNDQPFQSKFVSAEVEAFYTNRAR